MQFINNVSDVLHPSSGYNSGLQNFNLKKTYVLSIHHMGIKQL